MSTAADVESAVSTEADPIRLVIVDDHELVRAGLKMLVSQEPRIEVVSEADTVSEGVKRVAFDEPDVVTLDVDLPDGSGIDACRRMKEVSPRSRILILTAFADPMALAEGRQAGASGFLLKRTRDFQLVEAIRTVAAGGTAFDGEAPQPVRQADPVLSRLTERELTILELIAEGQTNREIADSLYLAEKTVKNYVSNLLAKMGVKHRSGAAAYLARIKTIENLAHPPSEWPA